MERPHYHGHRKRLRERFLKNGLAGFAEHEVVELLLTLAIPRADVKQPAKALLKRFGSLRGVLDATLSELRTRAQPPQRQPGAERARQGAHAGHRAGRGDHQASGGRSLGRVLGRCLQLPEGGVVVSVAPAILEHYPQLTKNQRAVVGHLDGPLLVIAGPGSGKTHSIVLRALNLLLLKQAEPGEIVLRTFTEKAALERRDRMAVAARKVGYGGDQWPYVRQELFEAQRFEPHERMPVKKTYSFTGDLRIYETCPRQYQFFRLYDFTPSRSAVIFFGLLVHQSIEEVHRVALDGRLHTLDETRIRELFERTFRFLCLSDVRPIGERAKESAFTQVIDCFRQNQDKMDRIVETEADVSLEKDDYFLAGKVNLLLGGDGKLELLDFKTSPRPRNSPGLIAAYEWQLCTYAHILERRHGRHVDRLLLYWTSEVRKEDALMVLPYRPERVDEAGRHFDATVGRIRAGEFSVTAPPEAAICRECDLRTLCRAEGVIGEIGDSEALAA